VDASSAHGIPARLTCSPRDYQHVRAVLDLMPLEDARRALAEFWRSPHFDAKRQVGMFAANAGQLLAHVGKPEPFGVKAPPTTTDPPRPRLKMAAEVKAEQAAREAEREARRLAAQRSAP